MSKSRKRPAGSSRRTFLKAAAGVAAGTVLTRQPLWAQSNGAAGVRSNAGFLKINPQLMITPRQALDWHLFKAECGPTYAGSTGWKRFADFLIARAPEFGAVDAFFAPVVFRAQTFGLPLGDAARAYTELMLSHAAMQEWYQAALKEPWREISHEKEVAALGTVQADYRLPPATGRPG